MSNSVTFKGAPVCVEGVFPGVGVEAPPLKLTNGALDDVSLDAWLGKRKVLNIVPSLDTPTCATSTRKFNEAAASLDNAVVLVVSADLPFAAGRFCSTEGLENVVHLSTFRNTQFMQDWGVLFGEGPLRGLTARAVVVLDENNKVVYSQLVGEVADEPDYDAALKAL